MLADFAQSKSLERSPSFTRRRTSRQDLNFPQANSLASVLVQPLRPLPSPLGVYVNLWKCLTLPQANCPASALMRHRSLYDTTGKRRDPRRLGGMGCGKQ